MAANYRYVCNDPSLRIEASFTKYASRRIWISLYVNDVAAIEWGNLNDNWTSDKVNLAVKVFCQWIHRQDEAELLSRTPSKKQMVTKYAFRMLKEVRTLMGKKIYERR
jgi:hypothetical protein